MREYFKALVARYFEYYLLPGALVLRIGLDEGLGNDLPGLGGTQGAISPDYVVLDGNLHVVDDIQGFLDRIHSVCGPNTRILIAYYSSLWRPALKVADLLGIRKGPSAQNWVSPSDVENFLELSDFELVSSSRRVLMPVPIPLLSDFINRWIAPLPVFNWFALLNLAVVKPKSVNPGALPSVSVVVAARNEAGNMEALFRRLPRMGAATELVVIEGGSTDSTWAELERLSGMDHGSLRVKIAKQDGKGKGDAIRKGFDLATHDVLMILDADLTVPPEDLPRFYEALAKGRGEFINGSRLVYPMEKKAMRFFNMIGNKFFALAFSFLLGRNFKDTLCGTKVMSREQYRRLAMNRGFFGEFDPFGDFDLIFGASRLGLKMIELPVHYRDRVYGETNISRWKHGWILLKMVWFAARKMRFI